MEAYEGDVVRPLGFVTLYFAYAEGQLDEVVNALTQISRGSTTKPLSFGHKVGEAVRLIEQVGVDRLPDLAKVLEEARALTEARNDLVHGQLFSGGRLVSREGVKQVTSQEIADLAERIFSWKERLWERYCRELLPLLSQSTELGVTQKKENGNG